MKPKNIFILSFILIIPFFIITGCKKETNLETQKSLIVSTQNQKILNLIKGFKKNMHSSLKSGDEMTIDSTIWYMAATLNESYARTDTTKKIIYEDSSFVTLALTPKGTVTMENINTAYSEMVQYLREFYHSFSGEKGVLLVDLMIKSVGNDQLIIKMDYIIARPGTYYIWFGPTDDWVWGELRGKCDGSHFGEDDAATKLTQHANWNIINETPPGVFYGDFTHFYMIAPWNVPLPNGTHNPYGYGDNYLFYHGSTIIPEYQVCLHQSEMNYYLANLFTIANIYQPSGKFIVNYHCYSQSDLGLGYWTHMHWLDLTYGIAVATNDPPEEL